jgi:hypothetical protein
MIMKAPTRAAPTIVRPASVLNHFWAMGPGLSFIIVLIHLLAPGVHQRSPAHTRCFI